MISCFIDFSVLQQHSKQLHEERQDKAESYFEQGEAAFRKAVESRFTDKDAAKTAAHCFSLSINHNPHNIKGYLGMACLLLVFNQATESVLCLQQAEKILPQDPQIQEMLAYAKEKSQKKPANSQLNLAAQIRQRNVDYEILYEQVEAFIYQQIRELMQTPVPLNPDGTALQIGFLQQQADKLQATEEKIRTQLKLIDQEIDVTALEMKLIPFTAQFKRIRQSLAVSKEFCAIKQEIAHHGQLVDQAYAQLDDLITTHQLPLIESQIEAFLDYCDKVADQLDSLDQQKHPIQALEPDYNQLVDKVKFLMESYDQLKDDQEGPI